MIHSTSQFHVSWKISEGLTVCEGLLVLFILQWVAGNRCDWWDIPAGQLAVIFSIGHRHVCAGSTRILRKRFYHNEENPILGTGNFSCVKFLAYTPKHPGIDRFNRMRQVAVTQCLIRSNQDGCICRMCGWGPVALWGWGLKITDGWNDDGGYYWMKLKYFPLNDLKKYFPSHLHTAMLPVSTIGSMLPSNQLKRKNSLPAARWCTAVSINEPPLPALLFGVCMRWR